MRSAVFICLLLALIVPPGALASRALLPRPLPGALRAATVFGLGYAAAAAVALLLTRVHVLYLSTYVAAWSAVVTALLIVLLRRDGPRGLIPHRVAEPRTMLLGAAVLVGVLAVNATYLHDVDTKHYIYFLDGLQIANSHGVPHVTVQYDQTWPLASDKILLDCFTAAAILFHPSTLAGPPALAWIALLGASLGLWATAEELGLRRVGFLAPLLLFANSRLTHLGFFTDFKEYRDEDFGRAIAFCALATGLRALYTRDRRLAVVAGLLLAAASGTHLIATVVIVLLLGVAVVVSLVLERWRDERLTRLRGLALAGTVALAGGAVVRLLAGGDFGLQGASDQSGYGRASHYDFGRYLYTLHLRRVGDHGGGHWYMAPVKVIGRFAADATGIHHARGTCELVLAALGVAALALLVVRRDRLRAVAVVGVTFGAALVLLALAFDWHYHVYIGATFGYRRLTDYGVLGPALVVLAALEAGFLYAARRRPRAAAAAVCGLALALGAWLLPAAVASRHWHAVDARRLALMNWVRTRTPCGARLLVSARPEGAFQALTGRVAITEGMGPFLRTDKLPHIARLFMGARAFYRAPGRHEAFLRRHRVTLVVAQLAHALRLGPQRLRVNQRALRRAPFLRRVYDGQGATVYAVVGARTPRPSPLLRGPYLRCQTTTTRF